MRQCNCCERGNCDVVDRHRSKIRRLTPEQLSRRCDRQIVPRTMKTPLMILALENNPAGVVEMLTRMKLKVQELADYPFYKIIVDKEAR